MRSTKFLAALASVAVTVLGAPPSDNGRATTAGSDLERAESCQSKIFAWRSSKQGYGSKHGHYTTSIFSSELTGFSYLHYETPTATSLITLCDGHARVVGQWTTHNQSSVPHTMSWTNTNTKFVPAPYPTPKPCSISPDECKLLYSSFTSRWNSITKATPDFSEGLLSPPCETSEPPPPVYSTNAEGGQCDNCLIGGSKIRLLYWPVTTIAGSGDLCDGKAETFTGTATGPLRSIVTEGVTITSPTVGVSIGGLSRVDGCGTTVDHTIIPVMPEDVSSVNGARALFTHKPFNFADLNYHCMDAPDEEFVTTGTRTDCYREVPASAYFFGLANAAGAQWYAPNAFENRTIWPNYQPQVLPPETMTQAIRSLWGEDCYIHPDGIWDPPIALQQEASFPLPVITPGAPTQYTTPPTDAPQPGGATTPDMPGPTQPSTPTAEAQINPHAGRPTSPSEQDPNHAGGSGWEADHHGGSDGDGAHGQDDGENSSGNAESGPSHQVVYTTVITYTGSAVDGEAEHTVGHASSAENVYTSTLLFTATESGHDEAESPSEAAGSASSDGSATSAGDDGGSPSQTAESGSISNAIESGIGGSSQENRPGSEGNGASGITASMLSGMCLVVGAIAFMM